MKNTFAATALLFWAFTLTTGAQATADPAAQPPTEPVTDTRNMSEAPSVPNAEMPTDLHICRVKSMVRFAEAPDLYVNDVKVDEISNGKRFMHRMPPNTTYTVKTSANPFLYRFRDEVLVKGKIAESVYVVIKAEANVAQGMTIFFGGAVAGAIRENTQVGDSKNWTTSIVTQEQFSAKCAE